MAVDELLTGSWEENAGAVEANRGGSGNVVACRRVISTKTDVDVVVVVKRILGAGWIGGADPKDKRILISKDDGLIGGGVGAHYTKHVGWLYSKLRLVVEKNHIVTFLIGHALKIDLLETSRIQCLGKPFLAVLCTPWL